MKIWSWVPGIWGRRQKDQEPNARFGSMRELYAKLSTWDRASKSVTYKAKVWLTKPKYELQEGKLLSPHKEWV